MLGVTSFWYMSFQDHEMDTSMERFFKDRIHFWKWGEVEWIVSDLAVS